MFACVSPTSSLGRRGKVATSLSVSRHHLAPAFDFDCNYFFIIDFALDCARSWLCLCSLFKASCIFRGPFFFLERVSLSYLCWVDRISRVLWYVGRQPVTTKVVHDRSSQQSGHWKELSKNRNGFVILHDTHCCIPFSGAGGRWQQKSSPIGWVSSIRYTGDIGMVFSVKTTHTAVHPVLGQVACDNGKGTLLDEQRSKRCLLWRQHTRPYTHAHILACTFWTRPVFSHCCT